MRLRLTLLYGSLFLVSGAALLVATNFLVDRATGVTGGTRSSSYTAVGT